MAVDLDTANSGILTRLGTLFGAAANAIALKGGAATTPVTSAASIQTLGTTIETMSAASPAVSDITDGHWAMVASAQSSLSGYLAALRAMAEKILVRQVDLDASLPSRDLTSALRELERQMRAATESVQSSTVAIGAQTAVGTPTGTPVAVANLKSKKGYVWQALLAEIIRIDCTGDTSGSATARNEPFRVRGAAAAPDAFSHLWPAGSGATATLSLCDAQKDNSGGNKLTNSDFETFTTSNYPDNWVAATGVIGTDIQAAGAGFTQSNALLLVSDGSTLTCLRQTFGTTASTSAGAGGTPGTLLPSTRYAVHGKAKVSATASTGTLRVRLVNGSNSVVSDDSATACSFTLDITTLTTSYASFSGSFVTPSVMPSSYKLELAYTTAPTSAKNVYIDDLALTPMTELYVGGPSFALFAALTNPAVGDTWTQTTTNTMGQFARWFERFFSLAAKNVVIPYSNSPTNSEVLITG